MLTSLDTLTSQPTAELPVVADRTGDLTRVFRSRHLHAERGSRNRTISSLFFSAPYPGDQKFSGHPTGLLYALTVLADRKATQDGRQAAIDELPVVCPDGATTFEGSAFERQLRDELRRRRPKVVGISTFSVSYQNALKAMEAIKKEAPETVVVFGGAHEDNFVSYYNSAGRVDADFVIVGDAMFILDELYKIIEENPNATITDLKCRVVEQASRFANLPGAGLLLLNHGERLRKIYSHPGDSGANGGPLGLASVPITPRYLLREEDSLSRQFSAFPGAKTAQMMLGQGCPYSCPFCSEAIKQHWYETDAPRSGDPIRNLPHVDAELRELQASGYNAIFFDDSTLLAKPVGFLERMTEKLGEYDFHWGGQTTQASIHARTDMLPAMVNAGLRYLYVGVEHFDGAMIDTFGKRVGAGNKFGKWSFEETLDLLQHYGIKTAISLTFGHPDPDHPEHRTRESPATVRFAIDLATNLAEQFSDTVMGVSLNLITYHPGTVISQQYEAKGLGPIDFVGHPNRREPFTLFEEGVGPHAPGMTDELVTEIWSYAKRKLADELFL